MMKCFSELSYHTTGSKKIKLADPKPTTAKILKETQKKTQIANTNTNR